MKLFNKNIYKYLLIILLQILRFPGTFFDPNEKQKRRDFCKCDAYEMMLCFS